ncbi:hypothetical protein K0651_10315 [Ornithinimicrobium sp. Arc0846-15]|nr:hypothetical protein [Ornithinimicrobium laminariae]
MTDLPLHPLVVHFSVVAILGTSLALIVAVVMPRFRLWLGWGLPLMGVLSAIVAFVTAQAGEDLSHEKAQISDVLNEHMGWGSRLETLTFGLAVMTILFYLGTPQRDPDKPRLGFLSPKWAQITVKVLAIAVAIAAIVLTYLAGDSGAQSVWG